MGLGPVAAVLHPGQLGGVERAESIQLVAADDLGIETDRCVEVGNGKPDMVDMGKSRQALVHRCAPVIP